MEQLVCSQAVLLFCLVHLIPVPQSARRSGWRTLIDDNFHLSSFGESSITLIFATDILALTLKKCIRVRSTTSIPKVLVSAHFHFIGLM